MKSVVACVLCALFFALAYAEGGEKVKEVLHEIGEKVLEAREKDLKDTNPFDRVVSVKFGLRGEKNDDGVFYEKINQIEALYWQDPAWETYNPESEADAGSKTTVSVIADPDITSLHAGRPAIYYMRYDVTYRKNPRKSGTEGYVVNGMPLLEAGVTARDVAKRTVEVTPIDWATCMNNPFDESIKDCRFIQYLNKASCQSFSPQYTQECREFEVWSGIIPDDAGPVIPISTMTSSVTNEMDEDGKLTGHFYIQCHEQEAAPKGDRRYYGLFQFPKDDDTYLPICSPCQRKGICSPNSKCVDLEGGKYECLCLPGYDKDEFDNCVRNHTNPEIQLRFKNKTQGYTKLKQCGRYHEEGYDVVVGNNPDTTNRHSYVDVEYPPELAAELIRHHGEFEVQYWLKGTTDETGTPPVTRRVVIEQVDRCGLRHCGEPCPENTLCHHNSGENYPNDIDCMCYQPRMCSNPDDESEEFLPPMYASKTQAAKEYHNLKKAEGYKYHMETPGGRCYMEDGEREETTCVDYAPPVLYYKDYKEPSLTCRVCNSSLTEGAFVEPDCWIFDFNDGHAERCKVETNHELIRINDTFSVENVKLVARDSQGLETTHTIQLFHHIQDISNDIEDLLRFRKQMRDFEAAVETFLYWVKLIFLTFVVVVLCWLAFTPEGMLFFRVLCRKVTSPSAEWKLHEANILAEDLYNEREQQKRYQQAQ